MDESFQEIKKTQPLINEIILKYMIGHFGIHHDVKLARQANVLCHEKWWYEVTCLIDS